MRKYLLLLLVAGLTFFMKEDVKAQGVTTASVNGTVTDAKGTIPGATITLTHLPTGTVYSTVTRADGRYNLINVRVGGPYTIKITFIGYKDFEQTDITLTIGQDQRIDAKLEDNTTALKEVTVSGTGGKVINSNRTGARETINNQQITSLPTLNRSLSDFTKLTPSATDNLSFGGRSNLFNNVTVDGALFNNSFGLASTLGGQTNSQPISLDAIDQIQVDIAPYDVRQGNFTGAGVNTVVKSGTNDFKGTIYDYKRSTWLTGYTAGPTTIPVTPFNYRLTGLSLGGPIIKNKLFFFVSGEEERISQPGTNYVASTGANSGANVSQASATTLNEIAQYLESHYNYPASALQYQGYNFDTYSNKATVKIDWNIDKNNVLSAKYFYLKSYGDHPPSNSGITNNGVGYGSTRDAGPVSLPFYGSGYRINNNFNIGIVELDTRISASMSNRLTAGYSALRDFRSFLGNDNLPMVDIGNGTSDALGNVVTAASGVLTSFGSELYTANNILYTNIAQFSDDFTIFAGKHQFTIGTSDQIQSYKNGFAPDYNGLYTYNSASDFLNGLPAQAYTVRYSALPDGSFPYAQIKAGVYSLYGQDKWNATDNLKITYGLRLDYDDFPTKLAQNPAVDTITFQQGIHVDPSVLPKNRVQMSPRLGFNWDVSGDHQTQVRGGTGLFAGLVPFVWISNQASNNGLLFGSYTITKKSDPTSSQLIFNPNTEANHPAPGTGAANTSYELDIANPNLKYPKIWRTNLAVDQRLPGGVIATLEGAYTKDINAIYHENLVLSDNYITLPGPEGQIRYTSKNITPTDAGVAQSASNPFITGLYYMTNTNQGYSYFGTFQLQKSFTNGLYFNVAYTHSGSEDVNDGGSTASTIWSSRQVAGNPNAPTLSNSSYVQPNRIIASAAWKKEYWDHTSTTFGLVYEMANNGAVSYITSGDPNGDGATNDLMWIPRAQGDIELVPDFNGDPRTPQQIWNQLNDFISQDQYLNSHRGQFAQRNGTILPYFHRLDLHFAQDFYITTGKVKNTLEFSVDIINFGNLLNKSWGLYQDAFNGFNSGNVAVLRYVGIDPNTGHAEYSFPYLDKANLIPVTHSFIYDTSQESRYQAQLGIRYIFN